MATRKKRIAKGASEADANRATAVILEQIHGQFRAFGEGLTTLREQMDRRFDRVEQHLALVKDAVTEHGRQLRDVREQLRDVRVQLGDLRVAVDKKVDRNDVEGIVELAIARTANR